jgi:hypothetical protein
MVVVASNARRERLAHIDRRGKAAPINPATVRAEVTRAGYNCRKPVARGQALIDSARSGLERARGRAMSKMEASYDYHRYRKLLAEAVDETKRLELIDQLIKEKARDRLEAQRTSDRVAMTAVTVAKILGPTARPR